MVRQHSTVTVVVSSGVGTASVPNVVGASLDDAKSQLTAAGFSVRIVKQTTTDPDEDGRVIQQSPRAGSRLQRGDFVTIFVGKFKEPPTTTTSTTTTPPGP